jgi:head-tail adaptor
VGDRQKISAGDRRVAVMLAEQHRREGHFDFVARTSKELAIPKHKIHLWLKQYRDGILRLDTEEFTSFSEYYGTAKSEAAAKSMQNTHKILDAIQDLNLKEDHAAARNLSSAYFNLWRGTQQMVEGVHAKSGGQQTNVQIVLPPKQDGEEREEIKIVENP